MISFKSVRQSIVIAGPTAIGKTAAAIALAQLAPEKFEIVSADSIQVYRRLNIGSAKPTFAERSAAAFHLIDVVEPNVDFTVVDYQTLAREAIEDIVHREKTPLIVGGTGLYIRSIINGLGIPVAGPDEILRRELEATAQTVGTAELHKELSTVDPESAGRIHENDLKRIIRALEVFKLTGRTLSSWHREDAMREKGEPMAYFALDRERGNLYSQIDRRSKQMFESGIVDEVAELRSLGFKESLKAMTSLGYLQANLVLDGTLSISDAIEQTQAATRHYARRQLIWFRGESAAEWINVEGASSDEVAKELFTRIKDRI